MNCKKIIKTTILWLLISGIYIDIVYFLNYEKIIMFFYDLKYFTPDGRNEILKMVIVGEILLAVMWIYTILNRNHLLSMKWDVRICGKSYSVSAGSLVGYYRQINKLLFAGVCGWLVFLVITSKFPMEREDTIPATKTVAHAMGIIDDVSYTNSLTAFEENYAKGHRVFEADFCVTSDKKMVCRHDWELEYQEGIDEEHIPTEEIFLKTPILGKYEPLSLEMLFDIMKEKEDIYIVTDTKEISNENVYEQFTILLDVAKQKDAMDILDRFIIQIYNDDMLEVVDSVYDFQSLIFTLYKVWKGDEGEFLQHLRFCEEHGIRHITMNYERVNPEILRMAEACGIEIYVHTVNDYNIATEFLGQGVSGVYTDSLVPGMLEEASR